jgi:hypothetical protein
MLGIPLFRPERPRRRARLLSLLVVTCLSALGAWSERTARADDVPSPESSLGYRPGADYRLAAWGDVVAYFEKVDRASDRVRVRELGKTTEGRPYLAAFVSSPETIKDLDRYRDLQANLSDPRKFQGAADRQRAVAESKPVVAITCSIHSTETASTLMAMELLHELATRDDPSTREVLDRTILILIPSANPDGVDKVAHWYERTRGHPWEGSGMVELYHKYAGHDTNRDWFMLNLKETRLFSRLLYKEWFPTLLYDVHQMGSRGARLFVPPFHDPINPNLDPRVHQGISIIGAHMAGDLAAAGKRGVLTHALYDNWWNGGNRTTPQRHNIVAVLTEAASVKMATPIFIEKEEIKGAGRGFSDHQPAVNFVDPLPGGWWRLRDIVDYELICARSLLTLAARYRETFQANLLAMSSDAVKAGTESPPHAWIVPRDQRDPGTAAALVRTLHDTGIEVHAALEPFQASGIRFPTGTWVLPAAQPYRAHLKDMMERQVYPTRLTAGGKAEPPYDVAGWTLPLQMGVRVVEAAVPIDVKTERLERIDSPKGGIDTVKLEGKPNYYLIANTTNDDFRVRAALQAAGVWVKMVAPGTNQNDEDDLGVGALIFPADARSRTVLDAILPRVSTRIRPGVISKPQAANEPGSSPVKIDDQRPAGVPVDFPRLPYTRELRKTRVAVYQPWMPSMDEGWTRLVLESFTIPYTTVHNAEIRAGGLRDRFDSLLIPSIDAKTLKNGYAANETEPAYVGGLGPEGVSALRAFVREGGTLVCLDASCEFAIDELDLPVKSVLKGLSTAEFYAPGSILRATVKTGTLLTFGVPEEVSVYFDHSLAFDLKPKGKATAVLRYASTNPLESGWLLGPSKIEGKAALVESPLGHGSVVLFGFRPQHRGQTHGTFRLLFNALLN